ncbi:hypothetical protein KKHLCK_07975 [Candidatus Electrothrix laxa]
MPLLLTAEGAPTYGSSNVEKKGKRNIENTRSMTSWKETDKIRKVRYRENSAKDYC